MNSYLPYRRGGKQGLDGWLRERSCNLSASELESSLLAGLIDLPHPKQTYDPDPGPTISQSPGYPVPYEEISRYDLPEVQDTPILPPLRVEHPWEVLHEVQELFSDLNVLGQMLERDPRLGKDPSLWPNAQEVMELFREAAEEVAAMDLESLERSEPVVPEPMAEDPFMGLDLMAMEPEPDLGPLEYQVQQAYEAIRSPQPDPMVEEEDEWRRQMELQQMFDPFAPPGS